MSAKTPKKSNAKKNDLKTTAVIILCVMMAFAVFVLTHKGKPEGKKIAVSKVSKHVEKTAPPVLPVKPVKKAAPGSAGRIAFILDDWGYTTINCKYLKEIKDPLAIAILPNLRHTNTIAKCAKDNGKVIMLHLPLQPYYNGDIYPDNYLITVTMKPEEVIRLLEGSLQQMPLVEGVNNHMGSRATEDKNLMKLIFQHLKKHHLFFVDSMTSPHHSVCGELADQMGLPFGQRDVFLDNVNTKPEIEKQILSLAQKARKKGYAVAIGHDRTLTLKVIQEQIPLLKDQGFEIVSIKNLLRNK